MIKAKIKNKYYLFKSKCVNYLDAIFFNSNEYAQNSIYSIKLEFNKISRSVCDSF